MKLVVAIAVGMRHKDVPQMSCLNDFLNQGSVSSITSPLPAVTTTAQASMLTGETPARHGIVGNGWYHRNTKEIRFWLQARTLIEAPTFIDVLQAEGYTVANLFWWFNMGSGARWSLTPRPEYPADGRKIPSVYGEPPELPVNLQDQLGTFPLFDFWGPRAGITSTRWIVDAALKVAQDSDPDVLVVYLPHLDYDDQRFGPDSSEGQRSRKELDVELSRLLEGCREKGAEAMVLSEYGIENVQQPVYKKGKKYITTCIFRLKSEPAALYKSLGGFATNQVNMTKLESFSVKNTFAQTNFYLDFEGHLEEKSVQNAMEELGFHTESLDILGVYEASNFRQN